jgi:hypothetical protein
MQIPIRFQDQQQQQYDTSRQQQQPQWLGSGGTQQYQAPQQQESVWKQGTYQQPQQGQQEFQPSWKSSQQQETGAWKQGMYQQPQQGYQQQGLGQQQTMFQQQAQFVEKTIPRQDVSVSDITVLHLLLRLSGVCYVKEHVLMKLCQDNTCIRNWHNSVTINNLDIFSKFVKVWGLTLPFPESLEKREHEVKQQLSNVSGNVITLGEALSDICGSAHMLHQELSCGYMSSCNEEFKQACKQACGILCEQYNNLKHAIKSTEQNFPLPIVKTVIFHEGVQSRR